MLKKSRFKAILTALCIVSLSATKYSKIVITIKNMPYSLDLVDADPYSFPILSNLYDPLLRVNSKGETIPSAAKRYEVNGKKIKFFIDSYYNDGTSVKADDFVLSFSRILTLSNFASRYVMIKNVQQFLDDKISFEEVGIKALSDSELEIELEREVDDPIRFFSGEFSFIAFSPVSTNKEKKYNGPFVLKEVKDEKITLLKNPLYKSQLDEVEFIVVRDSFTALNLLNAGEIDLILDIPGSYISDKIHQYLRSAKVSYIQVNTKRVEKSIREAISKAIDREKLCQVLKDGALPAYALIPYNYPGKEKTFREEAGEKLFKEFNSGEDKVSDDQIGENRISENKMNEKKDNLNRKYTLLIPSTEVFVKVSQFIQRELLKIGIELKIETMPGAIKQARVAKGDYDMALSGWMVDHSAPPFDFLDMFLSYAKDNYTFFNNRDFDELIEQAIKESRVENVYDKLIEAEKIVCTEFPVIPLYFGKSYYASSNNLKDIEIYNGCSNPNLRNASLR